MVTREDLQAVGFVKGTGGWPQETWVYDGNVWVYLESTPEAVRAVKDDDEPRAHWMADEIDGAGHLRSIVEARMAHERMLSATYDEACD